MNAFKNDAVRDADAHHGRIGADLVMFGVLALIFAPIVLAHLFFMVGEGSAVAAPATSPAPAAIERPADAR